MSLFMNFVGGLSVAAAASVCSASVAYSLDLETFYQTGAPSDRVAGPSGNPDTGFARFTNSGTSTFTGVFSLSGVDAGGNSYNTTFNATIGAGATFGSMSITNESSNNGGFNKVSGQADLGVLIRFVGTVTDGVNTDSLNLTVYDGDVHSGSFRTNPFGVLVDSYVLQGGDPFGRDTEDAFEVSQAAGHFNWSVIPAPSAVGAFGLFAVTGLRRRR